MILAYTNYDPRLKALEDAATEFAARARAQGINLRFYAGLATASRTAVEADLDASPALALVFFGHGETAPPPGLRIDSRNALLGPQDGGRLRRVIVALSCHAARVLGPNVAKVGGAILGFDEELMVFTGARSDVTKDCILALLAPLLAVNRNTMDDAASAGRAAFLAKATQLAASTSMMDLILSGILEQNAKAISVHGKAQRTIRTP
jgi:hypothetical protein